MERSHPALDDDGEILKVICTANAIEAPDACCRRRARARGYFPHDAAALESFTSSLGPWPGGAWQGTMGHRWKAPLGAFALTFEGRNPSTISARWAPRPPLIRQSHHRPHSAIGKVAPITRLDNLSGHHR